MRIKIANHKEVEISKLTFEEFCGMWERIKEMMTPEEFRTLKAKKKEEAENRIVANNAVINESTDSDLLMKLVSENYRLTCEIRRLWGISR